nr:hypothetical protein [uncultured bacterium]
MYLWIESLSLIGSSTNLPFLRSQLRKMLYQRRSLSVVPGGVGMLPVNFYRYVRVTLRSAHLQLRKMIAFKKDFSLKMGLLWLPLLSLMLGCRYVVGKLYLIRYVRVTLRSAVTIGNAGTLPSRTRLIESAYPARRNVLSNCLFEDLANKGKILA